MNFLSPFLLILLLSSLFHHSALPISKLQGTSLSLSSLSLYIYIVHKFINLEWFMFSDFGTEGAKESSMGTYDYQHVSFVGVEDVAHKFQRKVLHEVHSGPNPISNSVPQQRLKTKLRKIFP
ncbi:hypothetical protein CXB51_010152 [Gossypium anomalum]|uniref:Uncharacterized protein n=1 Tax=Gossypium anomalum TaxID=47600 RepID=A0A8J5Z2B9_9ROSI|nr:hypothetical protein CXB51_010152 [Gossypium anomalum]